MGDVESSVVVGDQGALVRGIDKPVVPNGSDEGEQPLDDTGKDTFVGSAAVLLESELALETPVDGLDSLSDPAQRATAWPLVAAVGPKQGGAEAEDDAFEVACSEALVGDDDDAASGRWLR